MTIEPANTTLASRPRTRFGAALSEQRWDDHRLYHHSRTNQSLHLFSACCFLTSYGLVAFDTARAVWIGWLLAWISRQIGHFFFEPTSYDAFNGMTHREKEAVKIGYNLKRKIGLLFAFLAAPIVLWISPGLFGLIEPARHEGGFLADLSLVWFAVGIGALLFRTLQLFVIRDVQTGVVWFTKILTDPFNDVRTYWKAPYYLFVRGERIDPALSTGASASSSAPTT